MIPKWVEQYVGLEYKDCGRGPEAFDCWGLVRQILKDQFNVDVPAYLYETSQDRKIVGPLIEDESKAYQPVEAGKEQLGDLVVLKLGNLPFHIGMVVGKGLLVHAMPETNSHLARYRDNPWKSRIRGFYRHIGMPCQ
ncbi:MAG: C40 family peptidase [Candidatus Obscuribacterales bacterium]|nr:C40 family peptidase [Candidatus Obscuribacterales bacterium]